VDSAKKSLIVDRTHPVLVRAVLQKNTIGPQKCSIIYLPVSS